MMVLQPEKQVLLHGKGKVVSNGKERTLARASAVSCTLMTTLFFGSLCYIPEHYTQYPGQLLRQVASY